MVLAQTRLGQILRAFANLGHLTARAVMNPVPHWEDYLRQTR
ncbi:hypothetical protein [Thalassovita sp.]|nr:hypothetical protein [Thalassovita sp.]